MSTVDGQAGETGRTANSAAVDVKLEAVVNPVADADRFKAFYADLGWRLDADFSYGNGFRVVQFTPPGFESQDGNGWSLHETIERLTGRLDPTTPSFNSAGDRAGALRRAESAHGEHEKQIDKADPNSFDRYAEYMVREQSSQELPA